MGFPRAALPFLAAVTLFTTSHGVSAQNLPAIPIDSFPPVSRQPIAAALDEVRAHPGDAGTVGRLGMLLQAWEQFDTAAAVYARARALAPVFEWYYLGGLVETRMGRAPNAAQLLAEAVRLAPGSVPARLSLADALFDAGDAAGATRIYSTLTEGPGAPHAHYGVGRCLAAGGDNDAALRELDAAVRLFPDFGAAWYSKGMVLRNLGRTEEARAALTRAQQLGAAWPAVEDPVLAGVRALRDDAATHVQRGLTLQERGDLAGAIAEYEAAVAANPRHAPAHVNLIALYGRQQQWTKAEEHYAAVLRLGTSLTEAHYNFGLCLATQGRSAEASAAFHKVLELNPQYAAAWNGLGQLAERNGRTDEAEASYRKAVEEAPSDPMIRFNLGRMLIARKQVRGRDRRAGTSRGARPPGARALPVRPGNGACAGR